MDKDDIKYALQYIELLKMKKELTNDFEEQMMFADEIHKYEMKLKGIKPTDSYIECVGCGS
jgi:hypothetical protein